MKRHFRLGAAVAAVTLSLGLSVSAGANSAQASTTSWHRVWRSWSWTANQLFSVTAVSASNAWAVGHKGDTALVMHWNGSGWSRLTVPGQTGFDAMLVKASAWNNVWVFGTSFGSGTAEILRFDGSAWSNVQLPAGAFANAATVLSPSDVWIAGPESCTNSGSTTQCESQVYHWNGGTWTSYMLPTLVNDISGSSADNVWLSAEGRATLDSTSYYLNAYKWNGSAWHFVSSMPTPRSKGSAGITVTSSGNVWLGAWLASDGDGYVLHWNGSYWARHTAPTSVPTSDELVTDGHSGVWSGPWAHWTGSRWVNTTPGPSFAGDYGFNLRGLARIPGRTTLWGVGDVSRTSTSSVWDSLVAVYGTLP